MRGEGPSPRALLWSIFVFALVVRLAVTAGTIGFSTPAAAEPASDSRIHMNLVQNLLNGHGFSYNGVPTAITPPLYIFFLAGLYTLFGHPAPVRVVQAVLGAASCVLLYATGRKMFNPATGLIAAVLLSMSPVLVYIGGLHLTENLFLPLLLLFLWLSTYVAERPTTISIAGLGVLLGLAALTRAAFSAFLPFVLIWGVSLWGVRNPLAYRVYGLAALCAGLVIMPWTVRNFVALGAVVPVQSNSGMMFWAGNNPHAAGGWIWPGSETWTDGSPPDDGMYGWRGLTVAQDNQRYMRAAVSWIREHPRDYLALLGRKLVRLYGFTRAEDGGNLQVSPAVVLFHMLFLVTAAAGVVLAVRQWRRCFLLLALVIFTNVTALLFSGGTRYTIPMIPSLTLFASVALVTVGAHVLQTVKPNALALGQLR